MQQRHYSKPVSHKEPTSARAASCISTKASIEASKDALLLLVERCLDKLLMLSCTLDKLLLSGCRGAAGPELADSSIVDFALPILESDNETSTGTARDLQLLFNSMAAPGRLNFYPVFLPLPS